MQVTQYKRDNLNCVESTVKSIIMQWIVIRISKKLIRVFIVMYSFNRESCENAA